VASLHGDAGMATLPQAGFSTWNPQLRYEFRLIDHNRSEAEMAGGKLRRLRRGFWVGSDADPIHPSGERLNDWNFIKPDFSL